MNYLPKIIHQQYFFFLGNNHPTASSSAIIIDTTFLPSHNKCIQICKHFNVIRGLISERESNLQNYFTFSTFILASTPQTIWTHLSESPLQAHHRPLCNRRNLHATPTNISHHSIWIKHEPGPHNTKTSPLTIKPSSNASNKEKEKLKSEGTQGKLAATGDWLSFCAATPFSLSFALTYSHLSLIHDHCCTRTHISPFSDLTTWSSLVQLQFSFV